MLSFPSQPSQPHADSREALAMLENLEVQLSGRRRPDSYSPHSSSQADQSMSHLRDLTDQAVWAVSTAKPGNGVEQILDGNPETYWQSDGPQPHTISAQFSSKVALSEVRIFLNYDKDESYTPAVISVRAGSNAHDLRLIRKLRKLRNPSGWIRIPLGELADDADAYSDDDSDLDHILTDDMSADDLASHNDRRETRRRARQQRKEERQASLDDSQRRAELSVNGRLEAMRNRSLTKAHMIQIIIHCNHQNGRDSHVRMVRVLGPKRQVARSTSRFRTLQFQMHQSHR